LRSLKISIKRTLWVILITASLPIAILESSSTQSDLFIGFLLISFFYLFYCGLKSNEKLPIFFSALAYAIAIGTKSTSILLIPVFAIVFIFIGMREKKKDCYKPFISFTIYFLVCFLLVSGYNYVLNYYSYGNIAGPPCFINNYLSSLKLKTFIPSLVLYGIHFADFYPHF